MTVLVSEYTEAILMNIHKVCCLVVQTVLLVCMLPYKLISSIIFPNTPKAFSSVFITGAGGGIGAEMARQYASKDVHLTLADLHTEKLSEVKLQCEKLGAVVNTISVDVTDKDKMRKAVCAADDECPLDLVIANAGVNAPTLLNKSSKVLSDVSSIVTEVNIIGVCNTLSPAIERMRSRKSGQLVITASFFGLLGMMGDKLTFAYASSKIWACTYGMGLRTILQSENVGVTVVCPGAIKTELLADVKAKGINLDKTAVDCGPAVKQMIQGVGKNVGVVYVNIGILTRLVVGVFGYNLIPPFLWNEAPLVITALGSN